MSSLERIAVQTVALPGAEAGEGAAALENATRLRLLRATGLLDAAGCPALDRLTRLAARLVEAPVALVSLVTDCRQVFPSAVGLPEPWATQRQTPLSHSFCQHVVAADAPLVVSDARLDERLSTNLAIPELGVVAYAGYPLRAPDGHTLGSFCVIDTRPRDWSPTELGTIADLAATVEAEIAIRLSHAELVAQAQRTHAILDVAVDAFVSADASGVVCAWNRAAEQLFGWSEVEALGRSLDDLIMPARLRGGHRAGMDGAEATGRVPHAGQRRELIAVDRAGREFPVEVMMQAHMENGERLFHAFVHDISDRKNREQALIDSEARFRSLFESAPIGMALVGLDGSWLRVNPAVLTITGYTADELLARDFQSITHPDDLDADLAQVGRLLAAEANDYRMHKRYVRKDGSVVWCLLSVTLLRDETGAPLHLLSQIIDVDAERRNTQLLDVTFAASPDLHLVTTAQGTVVRANHAWEQLLGWTETDLLGSDVAQLLHPEDCAAATAGRSINRYRTKTGQYRWVQWHGAAVPGHDLRVAAGRDITEARTLAEALRLSEEQSRAAFEASPLGMVIADADGRFIRVNASFAAMVDWSVDDLIGVTYLAVTHPDDLAESAAQTAQATADPAAVVTFETRFVRPDGRDVPARISLTTILGSDGQRHRLGQVEDITLRKQAEAQAVREIERMRTTIAVQREVASVAADRDAALALIADRTLAALPAAQYAAVGLIDGDTLQSTVVSGPIADQGHSNTPLTGSLSGLAITTGQTLRCDDTETDDRVDVEAVRQAGIRSLIAAPLYADGCPLGVLGVSSTLPHAFDDADVQQLTLLADALSGALRQAENGAHRTHLLRQATEAMATAEQSEAQFRLGFDNCPLGMVLTSLEETNVGTILQANPAMSALTGYPADELVGRRTHDLHYPEDHAQIDQTLTALRGGEADTMTIAKRYRHAAGHTVWVRLHVAVVRDERGTALYLVTQVEDVTAAREIEKQLRQRAQLLDLTQDAVIVRDLDGHIVYWNPAAERVYGWAAAAVIGHELDRLLGTTWKQTSTRAEVTHALMEHGTWEGELEHRRVDGQRVTVLSRKSLQRDSDGNPVAILSINTDVTARQANEQALLASEQRFRSQFAHSAIGQIIRGIDDRIQEVNPAFAAMLGYTPEQLVGTTIAGHLDPRSAVERERQLATLITGQADWCGQECQIIRADGTHLDVHITNSVIRDEHGYPDRFVGLFQDISDRKAAEAARDAAIADLADRNTELETTNQLKQDLIGMLGHEIGTPLASILGYTEVVLAKGDALPADQRVRMLETIDRNAHQLGGIVRQVLAMVTADAGHLTAVPESVQLRPHLDAARSAAERPDTNVGTPQLRFDCADDLIALIQPGHLDQILTNLLSNAAKYADGATALTAARHDDQIHITVTDAGPGVPIELRDQLFDRFTRAAGTAGSVTGTGLGLHIVRELARANGGDIHYRPGANRGSSFTLTVPAG